MPSKTVVCLFKFPSVDLDLSTGQVLKVQINKGNNSKSTQGSLRVPVNCT